jgi:hypothetical protein
MGGAGSASGSATAGHRQPAVRIGALHTRTPSLAFQAVNGRFAQGRGPGREHSRRTVCEGCCCAGDGSRLRVRPQPEQRKFSKGQTECDRRGDPPTTVKIPAAFRVSGRAQGLARAHRYRSRFECAGRGHLPVRQPPRGRPVAATACGCGPHWPGLCACACSRGVRAGLSRAAAFGSSSRAPRRRRPRFQRLGHRRLG